MVHNGIIENFDRLRNKLKDQGHEFHSATDSEVLAHLIGHAYPSEISPPDEVNVFRDAVIHGLKQVIGTYGISVICSDFPDVIIGA